jgi:predicted Zn-dependent peptidase
MRRRAASFVPAGLAGAAARVSATAVLAAALGAAAAPAPAAERAPTVARQAAAALEEQVSVHRLANGMVFLLLERRQAPVFAGAIRFRVGGMDEEPGRSGLAHLFEHLAFKGTSRIGIRDAVREAALLEEIEKQRNLLDEERARGADAERLRRIEERLAALQQEHQALLVPNEFAELYSTHGAVGLNATTDKDLTSYYVSLPANRLEMWCLMESERLRDGVVRQFYTERDVVKEERRLRIESSPIGKLYETLLTAAFGDTPYGIPTVGWMRDLDAMRAGDAVRFRRLHYRPENAVAALVGDFDTREAIRLVERYFGDWRSEGPAPAPAAAAPRPPGREPGALPAATLPARVEVTFPAEPYLLIGYGKPVRPHPDAAAFEMMAQVLTGGRTSLLHRRLVVERQMALQVEAFEAPGERLDNLFILAAVPRAPHTAGDVEAAILEELEGVVERAIPQPEIDKARTRVQSSFLRGLASNVGLALELTREQILRGDWKEMLRLLDEVDRLDAGALRRAAARYLRPERRVTAILVSAAEGAGR